jgi:hypothetical protein
MTANNHSTVAASYDPSTMTSPTSTPAGARANSEHASTFAAPETGANLSRTQSNDTTVAPSTPGVASPKYSPADIASSQSATTTPAEDEDIQRTSSNKPNFNKGRAFWMIMLSLAMSMFLSALDLTALSTALPRIATDLESENFTWIGSAYALASTAFREWCLPFSVFP